MNTQKLTTLFLFTLLITYLSSLSMAVRPDPNPNPDPNSDPNSYPQNPNGAADGGDGFFGPGGGFNIPGFDMPWGQGIGGGYGYGSGSPQGGYSRSGTIRPTVVCRERGPCYGKKLTCPAKCFTSFSSSGKGYGGGGGGGGCTMDCKKNCAAYC